MESLSKLMKDSPIVFYEAVMVARDPSHRPLGNTGSVLQEYNIIDRDGSMHGLVRTIIRAATDGEGLNMGIVNPLMPPQPDSP